MPDNSDLSSGGLLGVAAVGMAVCCGLPLLLAGGLVLSTVGIVAGSVILIAIGLGLALWAWRRHTARCCETPETAKTRSDEPTDTTTRLDSPRSQ